jgi:hypothetical protein
MSLSQYDEQKGRQYKKLYYRSGIVSRGLQNIQEFNTCVREMLEAFGSCETDQEKQIFFVKVYTFLKDNNIWLVHDVQDYRLKFAEKVYKIIKDLSAFPNFPTYNKIVQFFPIRLCTHCNTNTSNEQRLCKRCITIRVVLRKKIPSTLVKHLISVYGSSCEYQVKPLSFDDNRPKKIHSKSYNNHNWRNKK